MILPEWIRVVIGMGVPFVFLLKVCAKILDKDEEVREGNAQVTVEVKSGVKANIACGFAKARYKGEEVRKADFTVAIKV